ncbi:1044_t:CDS:2, partial [Funneliformis geosporum]
ASVVGLSIITKTIIMLNQLGLGTFRNVNVEPLGAEHTYGPHARTQDTREVVLNLTAATCMAPGITGGGSGRPNPSPCLVHFSCLVPKGIVFAYLKTGNDAVIKTIQFEGPTNNDKNFENNVNVSGGTIKIPIIRLAWGRSGDKGDTCNI